MEELGVRDAICEGVGVGPKYFKRKAPLAPKSGEFVQKLVMELKYGIWRRIHKKKTTRLVQERGSMQRELTLTPSRFACGGEAAPRFQRFSARVHRRP